MSRKIFIDTETTGLEVDAGNRIVELSCVVAEHRKLNGEYRQWYLNPQLQMGREVINVHGLDNEFLQDKQLFANMALEFIGFIEGAELIMHNAPFDTGFIDMELNKAGHSPLRSYCAEVVDSLDIARHMHPGQGNSLKALCARYNVDDSARVKHGALLDAELLAQVYFAMTSGQSSIELEVSSLQAAKGELDQGQGTKVELLANLSGRLLRMQASAEELKAHKSFIERIKSFCGKCLLDD